MIVRVDKFSGMAPAITPNLLPGNAAVTAKNCKLVSGALRSWRENLFEATPSLAGTKKTIFDYAGFWLHWLEEVHAVRSPLAADAYDRLYWSGKGVPQMAGNDIITAGGGTDYPTNSYDLGVPAPTGAPSLATSGAPVPSPADPLDQEDRVYVYTFVSVYGEEGPPSPVSGTLTWSPGQSVDISGMDAAPAGNYKITQKKIYRTNTGSSGTEYQLVATIPIASPTYTDAVASESLSVVLPSAEWDAPPSDLFGLQVHPAGFLFGFSGREICFSEPYRPHAWPVAYRIPVKDTIIGGGAFGSSIAVLTEGLPILVTGTDPSALSVERFEVGASCVSARGIVDLGYAVAYPSGDGLEVVGINDMGTATEGILSRDDWQAYKPESIHAYLYAGKYIAFYDNGTTQGGFIFDPKEKSLSELDFYATAGFSRPDTGELFLQVGADIVKFDSGANYLDRQWKSKPFRALGPVNLGAGQVFADSYPVDLKVYADGVLKHTQVVTSNRPFRLPAGFTAQTWQIEDVSDGGPSVETMLLATTIGELGSVA